MIITEILARNARRYGPEIALIERSPAENMRTEITWRAFDEQANRTARALIARGIKKGDRVVQLMTNCLQWLPIYFGILRTGAWVVPLNFRFNADTICRCSLLSEARVIIYGEAFSERIEAVKERLDEVIETYVFTGKDKVKPEFAIGYREMISAVQPLDPQIDIDPEDEAALYFTSGTTGVPKATLLTHRNLEFACYTENRHHGQTRKDNFLCIPPLYHTGAKMHWFGNFLVGARSVLLKGVKPEWILEAISEEGITVVWLLVPWALDILFAIQSGQITLADYHLDQWRLMHIGAQPVPPSLIKEWHRLFPNHQYDTNYGLTEATGPGCIHLGVKNMHKIGAIGRPGFDWEYKIVDHNNRPVTGQTPGELSLRGPGIMKEYYKNPQATRKALVDGWLMTGDIVRQDADGFIWIVDRAKDVIITGGENIYPVEIEDFLQEHDCVADVAVIGLPSPRLGEIATAVIQIKPGMELGEKEVLEFCEGLPRYKRPRKIIFSAVPRNPTGKIEKPALRKRYGGNCESFRS